MGKLIAFLAFSISTACYGDAKVDSVNSCFNDIGYTSYKATSVENGKVTVAISGIERPTIFSRRDPINSQVNFESLLEEMHYAINVKLGQAARDVEKKSPLGIENAFKNSVSGLLGNCINAFKAMGASPKRLETIRKEKISRKDGYLEFLNYGAGSLNGSSDGPQSTK